MESDIGSWTSGDMGVRIGTPEILHILKKHQAQATFLFTGREARNHPKIVRKILSDGHEIGCHTMYHESIGTAVFDMPGANFVLESEIKNRLALATRTVAKVAGCKLVSFRAPRLFGSAAMINALEELGYLVDSSFPAYFYGRDFSPYNPSRRDWAKNGRSKILELPVFYDTDVKPGNKTHRQRDQWPMLRLKGAKMFSDLCLRMIGKAKTQKGHSLLCIYLHPWEFVPMSKVIVTDEAKISFKPFLYKNCGPAALNALDAFVGQMKEDGLEFRTMRDVVYL